MSIISPIGLQGYPVDYRPYTDITPFTYRDAATYQSILESMRVWLSNTLVPAVNDNFEGMQDAWVENVTRLTADIGERIVANSVQLSDATVVAATHTSPASNGVDDSAQLNAWFASLTGGGTLRAGETYKVSTTLVIPAGQRITGYGAKLVGLPATTGPTGLTIVNLGQHSELVGVEIDGNKANRNGGNGVTVPVSGRFRILDCYIHDTSAAGISVTDLTTGVAWVVANNRVSRAGTVGIYIASGNGIIVGNHIDGGLTSATGSTGVHGIQWWGGDSAASPQPPVGVFHLTVANNQVKNVAGGIWGSLGQYITVTGNDIDTVYDVGIDFEGCRDSVASGNTVHNAKSSCLSVFNGSKRVRFTGNTCFNDTAAPTGGAGAAFRSYTSVTSTDVTVVGNTFNTQASAVDTDSGSLTDSTVSDNKIIVNTAGAKAVRILDCGQVDVLNNRIVCAGPTGISFEGPSDSTIAGNRIVTTGGDTSVLGDTSGGIFLYARSTTYPCRRNRVKNNTLSGGFVQGIHDKFSATGNADTLNLIEDNVATTINRSAGTGYTGVINNNRSTTLTATTPTTV